MLAIIGPLFHVGMVELGIGLLTLLVGAVIWGRGGVLWGLGAAVCWFAAAILTPADPLTTLLAFMLCVLGGATARICGEFQRHTLTNG